MQICFGSGQRWFSFDGFWRFRLDPLMVGFCDGG